MYIMFNNVDMIITITKYYNNLTEQSQACALPWYAPIYHNIRDMAFNRSPHTKDHEHLTNDLNIYSSHSTASHASISSLGYQMLVPTKNRTISETPISISMPIATHLLSMRPTKGMSNPLPAPISKPIPKPVLTTCMHSNWSRKYLNYRKH